MRLAGNATLVYLILKNKKRFEALRSFTLESGQAELERRNQQKKENGQNNDPLDMSSRRSSLESLRSPTTTAQTRTSTLRGVQEDTTFTIGDDDDDDEDSDDEVRPTPAQSSPSDNP